MKATPIWVLKISDYKNLWKIQSAKIIEFYCSKTDQGSIDKKRPSLENFGYWVVEDGERGGRG